MEDVLNYENRDSLYKFLIDDFGFMKVEEKYDSKAFGNFLIILSAKEFLLQYVNDRLYLTIEIASHAEPTKWLALSFVRDFIYNPDTINSGDKLANSARISELNAFIKKDFDLIADLFDRDNYEDTRQKIDKLLKEKFERKFPGTM